MVSSPPSAASSPPTPPSLERWWTRSTKSSVARPRRATPTRYRSPGAPQTISRASPPGSRPLAVSPTSWPRDYSRSTVSAPRKCWTRPGTTTPCGCRSLLRLPPNAASSWCVSRPLRAGTAKNYVRINQEVLLMETGRSKEGILSEEMASKREEIVELLKQAYFAELETVINYVTNSTNPDGVRAQEIKEALEEDIQEELGHAQQFAQRIKELYGVVPGSMDFRAERQFLQPPEHQTDVVHVIKGVIDAETKAIELYTQIVDVTDGVDLVTQDMVIDILRDEQGH